MICSRCPHVVHQRPVRPLWVWVSTVWSPSAHMTSASPRPLALRTTATLVTSVMVPFARRSPGMSVGGEVISTRSPTFIAYHLLSSGVSPPGPTSVDVRPGGAGDRCPPPQGTALGRGLVLLGRDLGLRRRGLGGGRLLGGLLLGLPERGLHGLADGRDLGLGLGHVLRRDALLLVGLHRVGEAALEVLALRAEGAVGVHDQLPDHVADVVLRDVLLEELHLQVLDGDVAIHEPRLLREPGCRTRLLL